MINYLLDGVELASCAKNRQPLTALARAAACAVAVLAATAGCQTAPHHSTSPPPQRPTNAPPAVTNAGSTNASSASTSLESTNSNKSLMLQEGDTIKIIFPGAPNLDTTQGIRRDGKITLEMVGEYDAAGKTPAEVETDLKKLYATQIVNSDVSVTVQSSAFVIYVMGAIVKPGKLISERPLSVLEALIECGIDETKANLKAIQIIRTDNAGHTEKTKLDLHKFLHNKNAQMPSFTLKPYDVINVPEKFNFY